jgi:ABC-type enterochelin transport system ATPase subunit
MRKVRAKSYGDDVDNLTLRVTQCQYPWLNLLLDVNLQNLSINRDLSCMHTMSRMSTLLTVGVKQNLIIIVRGINYCSLQTGHSISICMELFWNL